MSLSVLRRYTPPTCTLEIMGSQSPLSRWMGQPVLKQLRFQLNLDDPKLPEDKWVTLRGDRAQLDALCEVVTTYVQQFLEGVPELADGRGAVSNGSPIALVPTLTAQASTLQSVPSNSAGILLQPRGLLSHELVLGELATEETGSVTHLSALQLFDLANALDEYTTEVVALPTLQPAQSSWLKRSPAWAQIAAVTLVVVGLSTSIAKLWDGSYTAKNAAPTTSQGASSSDQKIATQLPPAAMNEQPAPLALPNQKLPPAPPIGSTGSPAPGLPNGLKPQIVAPLPSMKQSTTGAGSPVPADSSRDGFAAKTRQDTTANELRVAKSQPLPAPLAGELKPELADDAPARRAAAGAASRGADSLAANESTAQNGTPFDTIPQVAEARRYFQGRWTSPQGLTQVLEYRLVIGANGSLQQIIPLGLTSGDYIDRTGIPLVGEPFVSPLNSKRNATIRLVLSPDGRVQTFLERVE
ncbi:DUF4335 domain-containing protein [Kovacikia minuta CCNUW1]|uniref:DUF4335 domain-containing protein n=1 Tax=Kovacikia minuta TaxID=2931930 RepID=UPI001CCCDF5E|nr:DUF4335 domain-containing protein [Kovacikia minuta]UBF24738.1 DUF4335 domain-containing protein [Kovacikia minuta CCNUW1]